MNERHGDTRLSDAGEARKREMLGELAGEMERVRVGRVRRKRAVVGVCVLGVVAVGVWFGMRGQAAVQPREELAGPVDENVVPVVKDGFKIVRVGGTSTLDVVRDIGGDITTEIVTGASGVERAGDSVLLTELNRMGRPTGLIRRGGAVYLTASVGRVPAPPVEATDEPGA